MKIEVFALCDFAADYGGKFSVVGVFDTFFAQQLPARHPFCCIAVRMRFERIEEGPKRAKLSICDQDGKSLIPPIEIPIQVTMPPGHDSNTIQVVGNLGGVTLEQFGEYSVDLAVDGRHEGRLPFFVRRPEGRGA